MYKYQDMSSSLTITRNTLLKDLTPSQLRKLKDLLNTRDKYKRLGSVIRTVEGRFVFDITTLDALESGSRHKTPAESVLDNWNYDNPNIQKLIDALEEASLIEERNHVIRELLRESIDHFPVEDEFERERIPTQDLPLPRKRNSSSEVPTTLVKVIEDDKFRFPYRKLADATCNFDINRRKLGKGGFGYVFLGELNGKKVAIKRLEALDKDSRNLEKQFKAELLLLHDLKHPNVVELIGYSDDDLWCLVYEYMPNGSLDERLKGKLRSSNVSPLTIYQRLTILAGAAAGLVYLHEKSYIHRDVKTANILLGNKMDAKMGDCGLVRLITDEHDTTATLIGTLGYMPLEYCRHRKVSEKMDTYAFGVVMSEVMTGLPPRNRDKKFLADMILEDYTSLCEFETLMDRSAGEWPASLVGEMHQVAMLFLNENYNERPTIRSLLPQIQLWADQHLMYT